MRVTRRGRPGDEDLLVVLGWGNRPEHEHVAWLLTRLVEAGYRVHAVTIPTNGWDFEAQYRAPVASYTADRDFEAVLSHSTGGLVAEHLDGYRNVFLSPWWGIATDGWLDRVVTDLFTKIPSARRLYDPDFGPDAIGDLKSAAEAAAGPQGISPAFLATIREAQSRLGPFDDGDVVVYTPSDRIVDPDAIEARVPPVNRRKYDGGHEFFASSGREEILEDVLAALESGPAAFEGSDGTDE
ncbi:alpha/beta fold hydrolase [Halobellus sp. EA9]|uniref:alpha/beta fold hydrolase n=1 Tax=Halobellus sp. EA9 TaxID=3421647 RepID=UPI003EBAAD7A